MLHIDSVVRSESPARARARMVRIEEPRVTVISSKAR